MFDDTEAIRHNEAPARPVLRIAVPTWAFAFQKTRAEKTEVRAPTREEFKQILDAALHPNERIYGRMTRGERKQITATRKVRLALYGQQGDLA
jgi:hypothetical protein